MRKDYLRLSAGGFASKILGVAREIALAGLFGTGRVADAYRASLSVTLSPVHLLTSRVVQTCFVPLYARYEKDDNEAKGAALFHSLLLSFVLLGLGLGAFLYFFAEPVIAFILRGFDQDRTALAARMLRIMAVGVPFYVFTSVLGALGAARKDFVIPSVRPGAQNLSMLLCILVAARFRRPEIAAWGFSGAYIVLSFGAAVHLLRRGLLPARPRLHLPLVREAGRELWTIARPLLLLSAWVEASLLIERYVASLLGPGRVAAVEYARFVTETTHFLLAAPLGLLGLTYFAGLTEEETRAKAERILALLFAGLIPFCAFLFVGGRALLALLYLRGEFGEDSLLVTDRALRGFAAGLWIFSASFVLQRIANARLRNHVVLRAESIAIAVNIAFNLLLYRFLGVSVVGLGIGAASMVSFFVYSRNLRPVGPLAKRGFLLAAAGALPYLLLAMILRRFTGDHPVGLVAQAPFALLFWGLWLGRSRETRLLFRGQWERRNQ
ncbi:MAG: lipid II flippase MurJ [Candidatus Eisenbacteria bacterium]